MSAEARVYTDFPCKYFTDYMQTFTFRASGGDRTSLFAILSHICAGHSKSIIMLGAALLFWEVLGVFVKFVTC